MLVIGFSTQEDYGAELVLQPFLGGAERVDGLVGGPVREWHAAVGQNQWDPILG